MTIDQPGPLDPVAAPQPEEPRTLPDSWLETAVGVVTEPVPTLGAIVRAAPLGAAFLLIAFISILSAVTTVAQLRAAPIVPGAPPLPIPEGPITWIVAIIVGPILGIVGSAIVAGILHVVALMLGGKGPYKGLFCGLAFASIPSLFQIPLQLAGIALGPVVQAIVGIVSFGISIWTVALAVICVRENNGFSTGRAVAVVLIPLGLVVALVVGLIVLALVFAVGGAAGLFSQ